MFEFVKYVLLILIFKKVKIMKKAFKIASRLVWSTEVNGTESALTSELVGKAFKGSVVKTLHS